MTFPDTVTFGTPLIARAVAQDWASVEHQLSAMIGAIYNQTDPNFRIILACSDKSALNVATDGRLEFLPSQQTPAVDNTIFITDAVRRRWRIGRRLRELGGGYDRPP